MRSILIALVLFVTALTFYSALWYKSEVIEDDITARVTEDLEASDAKNVAIDVDGRHVTLSGVVYDEATEAAYLKTADETYGALGPIDGLTYQADGGYLSAVKSDAGITLRGTVANEEVRAALVASAASATDGAVDDQTSIAGPTAAWQDEAAFGVSQLAGLTTGNMNASAGTFALSGSTAGNPSDINAALAGRDGWQAFVTSEADTGYVTAVKAADGITLRGTVPNADLRAALVANATAATEGAVNDNLQLGGSVAGWQDEAAFGVSQLAGLTSGTLTAAEGTLSLSGNTDGDPADVTAAFAGREGWMSNISSPMAVRGLSDNVTSLNGQLAARDATITDLNAKVGALTTERDTVGAELDALRANLTEGQSATETLRATLGTAQADLSNAQDMIAQKDTMLAEKDAMIAEKDAMVEGLNGRITGLETDLANRQSALGATDEQVATLMGDLDTSKASIADLTATVADQDQMITGLKADIGSRDAKLADVTAQFDARGQMISSLKSQIGEQNQTIASLRTVTTSANVGTDQVAALTAEIEERDGMIASLKGQRAESDGEVARLTGELQTRDGSLASTAAMLAALKETSEANEGEAEALKAKVADLTGEVADLDTKIADLMAAAQNTGPDASEMQAKVADLTSELTERDSKIADLMAVNQSTGSETEAMQAKVADLTAGLTERDSKIADLMALNQSTGSEAEAMQAKVAALMADVEQRDVTIASLRDAPRTSGPSAEQCTTNAQIAIEGERINFDTSTATIKRESIPVLERLTGVALACVGEGLTVEVGGHTDSQGSEANNQKLSEARAQAVVAYMAARGVPTDGLKAVGYGEGNPIADNNTREGRAQNRRISFDWQAR